MSLAPLARGRAHASRPSSSALLHGLGGLAAGAAMIGESPRGYAPAVFDGPRAILAFAPNPIAAWGAIFLVTGALVLAFRAGGSRIALTALAGTWATFGTGALVLGITSPDAAGIGGIAFLIIAFDAARAALTYARTAATFPLIPERAVALERASPTAGEEPPTPRT